MTTEQSVVFVETNGINTRFIARTKPRSVAEQFRLTDFQKQNFHNKKKHFACMTTEQSVVFVETNGIIAKFLAEDIRYQPI